MSNSPDRCCHPDLAPAPSHGMVLHLDNLMTRRQQVVHASTINAKTRDLQGHIDPESLTIIWPEHK